MHSATIKKIKFGVCFIILIDSFKGSCQNKLSKGSCSEAAFQNTSICNEKYHKGGIQNYVIRNGL